MGIFSGTKTSMVTDDAKKAREQGRRVFVCLFKSGMISGGTTSGALSHVGEMIEAVEDQGWRLEHIGYSDADSKSDRIVGLFRRADVTV